MKDKRGGGFEVDVKKTDFYGGALFEFRSFEDLGIKEQLTVGDYGLTRLVLDWLGYWGTKEQAGFLSELIAMLKEEDLIAVVKRKRDRP